MLHELRILFHENRIIRKRKQDSNLHQQDAKFRTTVKQLCETFTVLMSSENLDASFKYLFTFCIVLFIELAKQ